MWLLILRPPLRLYSLSNRFELLGSPELRRQVSYGLSDLSFERDIDNRP